MLNGHRVDVYVHSPRGIVICDCFFVIFCSRVCWVVVVLLSDGRKDYLSSVLPKIKP